MIIKIKPGIKKTKSYILLFLVLALLFLAVAAYYNLPAFLSTNKKVNANILLVEGWLPQYDIKAASNEFKQNGYDFILTTGIKAGFKTFLMDQNGFLVFYPGQRLPADTVVTNHTIEVLAYGSTEGENSSHFNVFVNSQPVGNFNAELKAGLYSVSWEGALSDIDSIMVQFTNDAMGNSFDRNLFVRHIVVDKKHIIPSLNYSVYDIGKLDNKWRSKNGFISYAEMAKNELISFDISDTTIIAIPGDTTRVNRTLASALAVRNWLDSSSMNIEGINIISSGMHARRTWMIYKRILGDSYNIGIISTPDYKNNSRKAKVIKMVRESLGLIYYWFVLLAY